MQTFLYPLMGWLRQLAALFYGFGMDGPETNGSEPRRWPHVVNSRPPTWLRANMSVALLAIVFWMGASGLALGQAATSIARFPETVCPNVTTPVSVTARYVGGGGDPIQNFGATSFNVSFSLIQSGVSIATANAAPNSTTATITVPASATSGSLIFILSSTTAIIGGSPSIGAFQTIGGLTVRPTAVAVSLMPSQTAICAGSSVTLTASATGGSNFSYAFGNETLPGSTSATRTVTVPPGTNTYSVTATDGDGCVDVGTTTVTGFGFTNTQNVLRFPLTVCPGDVASLTANYGGTPAGTAPFQVVFSLLDVAANTTVASVVAAPNSISATIAVPATVTATSLQIVVLTTSGSCVASFTTVGPLQVSQPRASLMPSQTAICAGSSVTLTASATGGSNFSYAFGNEALPGSTSAVRTMTVPMVGANIFSVTATNSLGCAATGSTTVTSVTFTNAQNLSRFPTSVCPGGVVSVTANYVSNAGGTPAGAAPFQVVFGLLDATNTIIASFTAAPNSNTALLTIPASVTGTSISVVITTTTGVCVGSTTTTTTNSISNASCVVCKV